MLNDHFREVRLEMTEEQKTEQQRQADAGFGEGDTEGAGAVAPEFDPDQAELKDWLALVEQKDEEIKQLKDRLLRNAAEMDNTRKRLERERAESVCYANESLIRDLLPIVDNLERAMEHAQKEADARSLVDGVAITLKSFQDTLARYGCGSFEALGKPFDPNYHEAVMQEESDEYPQSAVLRELQKGYTLHTRLLRPAMVVVSKPSATHQTGAGSAQEEATL
jgi:molecular chaperone GrpE